MAIIDDAMLKRQIIMDHNDNPRNRSLVSDNLDYSSVRKDSDSCIDDITIQVKFNQDLIEDIRFDGEACTVTTSSTSILTEMVKGKSIKEAKIFMDNYYNMIYEKDYSEDILEEAVAFSNISKQANRIKCATIGIDALYEVLNEYEKRNLNE